MSSRSFFLYISKDSFMHKLNPLTKLTLVLVISFVPYLIEDLLGRLVIVLIGIFLLGVSKVQIGVMKKFLVGLILMLNTIFLGFLLFSHIEGSIILVDTTVIDTVFLLWPIEWAIFITENTIIHSIKIYLRVLAMSILTIFFFTTTKDRDIIYSLRLLKIPYAIIFVLVVTLRSMSMFVDDFFTIRDANICKGVDFNRGNPISRIKKYISLINPLVMFLIKRIEEMTFAATSKGYIIKGQRTYYWTYPFKKPDYLILVLVVALFGTFFFGFLFDITVTQILLIVSERVSWLNGGIPWLKKLS